MSQAKNTIDTLLFDGYCPESALQGKQVPLRLSQDDFWESPVTGLQLTAFPPYAAILRWRGKGKFKLHEEVATDYCKALLLTKACLEKGREIYPDESEILSTAVALEQYLRQIYKSAAAYCQAQFDETAPLLQAQAVYLETIATEEWVDLIGLYEQVRQEGVLSPMLTVLQEQLHRIGVIFDFAEHKWQEGQWQLQRTQPDFSQASLLQLSMYLTLIFRSKGFTHRAIQHYFKQGVLDGLFKRLEEIT